MARTITLSADKFQQNIFGPHAYPDEEFYYQGSSNARAQRSDNQLNPNIEPIPFSIPSRRYSDSHFIRHQQKPYGMNQQEWNDSITSPNYIIEGYLLLGGHIDYRTATINRKNFSTGISIGSCSFGGQVNINYFETKSYIKFYGCTFASGVSLLNIKATEISFVNCDFTGSTFKVNNCSIEKLSLDSCSNLSIGVENDKKPSLPHLSQVIINDIDHKIILCSFNEINHANNITVAGKDIGKITFKNVVCKEVEFDVKIDGIQIFYEKSEESGPDFLLINKFNAHIDENSESFISILENLYINDFSLTGTLKNATFIAIALTISKLLIKDFINEGKFRLNDVSLSDEGTGELIRSQFGKTEFNYVDFSKAKSFKIYLSNITEIIINNTQFPNNITGKNNTDLHGIREIYRQLKNAASKQGDRVYELYYEKIEMISYEKTLENTENWNDKIIFWTNKVSNDFGQNWMIAGSLLMIVCSYLFFAIKLILINMHFEHIPTFRHLAQFVNFTLNPLHKFSEIFGSNHDKIDSMQLGFAETLDTISRLFSGYMLFQFLRAFRKYSR